MIDDRYLMIDDRSWRVAFLLVSSIDFPDHARTVRKSPNAKTLALIGG